MNYSTLFTILLYVLAAWFLYSRFRSVKGLVNYNAAQFREEMQKNKNKLLLDVREPGEYQGGHIPGAKNFPLSKLSSELSRIPKDKSLLLYCRSGMRSKQAAKLLLKNGYSNVAHLQGGLQSWKGETSR